MKALARLQELIAAAVFAPQAAPGDQTDALIAQEARRQQGEARLDQGLAPQDR